MSDWEKCDHHWGPVISIREPNFGVAYASKRVCTKCKAVEYEDWCETRASGGEPRVYPPEVES